LRRLSLLPYPTLFRSDVLHHQERGLRVAAEVVDVDHSGVLEPGHGTRLGPEPLAEPGLVQQCRKHDLDGDGPAEHLVGAAPHLSHAAATDPLVQPVAAPELRSRTVHQPPPWSSMTARITAPAILAASAEPPLPAFSSITATAVIGVPSTIAKPTNQPWSGSSPVSAVPVLPPTTAPAIWAFRPVPSATTPTIMSCRTSATSLG